MDPFVRCGAWHYPGRSSWDGKLLSRKDGLPCVLRERHPGGHLTQEHLDRLLSAVYEAQSGGSAVFDQPPTSVMVEAVATWDAKGEALERLRDLAQVAREGAYQVIQSDLLGAGEPVVLISAKELGRLGLRAGYRSDQKYASLLEPRAEGDLTREESIAEIDRGLAVEGFTRIGDACSVGRRSVWMRLTHFPEQLTPEERASRVAAGLNPYRPLVDDHTTVESIAFKAGREGDDVELVVDHSNMQFKEILALCCWLREVRFNPQEG